MYAMSRIRFCRSFSTRLTLAALAAFLLVACEDQGLLNPEEHFARAQERESAGDATGAIIELKNVLQQEPDNAKARLALAGLLYRAGDFNGAETEARRASEVGADPLEASNQIGKSMLLAGDYEKVVKEFSTQKDLPDRLKSIALTHRGNALRSLERITEAEIDLHVAQTLDPANVDAVIGLARLAATRKDLDQAERLLARAQEMAPDSFDVLQLKGDLAADRDRHDEAEEIFRELKQRRPFNPFMDVPIARVKIAAGDTKGAIPLLEGVLEKAAKYGGALYLLAVAHQIEGDFAAAQRYANEVLGLLPDHLPSLLIAGASSFGVGDHEQAAKYLRGYLSEEPEHPHARRLYGSTLLKLGRPQEAFEILEPLAEAGPDDAELLELIGHAAAQGEDFETGVTYLGKAAALEPDDSAKHMNLGVVRIRLGDTDQGIAALKRAVELDPERDAATMALFGTLVQNKRFDEALELAQRLQTDRADKPTGWVLAGIVHVARREADKGRAAFRKALEINPAAADASQNLASLEMMAGNMDEARTVLERAHARSPENTAIMMLLATLEATVGKKDEGREWLEKAASTAPDEPLPRLELARYYVMMGSPDVALGLTQDLLHKNPDNPDLLLVIGQAQLLGAQFDDAAVTMRKLVSLQPDNLKAHYILATAYLNLKDARRLKEQVETVLRLDPEHLPSKSFLVRILVEEGDVAGAKKLVATLLKSDPENSEVLDVDGLIAMAEERYPDAIERFKQADAARATPSRDTTINLATSQWSIGQREASFETLRSWLEAYPNDNGVRLILGTRYLEAGNLSEARSRFASIVDRQPDNWVARNNLAWVLLERQEVDQAVAQAERALLIVPESADVMDTLGAALLRAGQAARAVDVLRRAAGIRPESGTIRYRLASALAELGEVAEAREILGEVLASDEDFKQRGDAEALLARLRN